MNHGRPQMRMRNLATMPIPNMHTTYRASPTATAKDPQMSHTEEVTMKTDLDNAATWIQVMTGIGIAACIATLTITIGALIGHLIGRKTWR